MQKKNQGTLMAAAAAGLVAVPGIAAADTIELTGTIRDFKVSHPDMQYEDKSFGVRTNLVEMELDAEGKPVLNEDVSYHNGMITSPSTFAQWFRDVPGVNLAIPYTIVLDNGMDEPGGLYTFAVEKPYYFFPITGMGWNDRATDKNGASQNFYFTYEIKTEFTYSDPADRDWAMVFTFVGDDDVWVYINGKLAVDLGGVHGQATDSVNLDNDAEERGLEPGETYTLDFFFAERHTTESNFRIETTMLLKEVPPTSVSPLYD